MASNPSSGDQMGDSGNGQNQPFGGSEASNSGRGTRGGKGRKRARDNSVASSNAGASNSAGGSNDAGGSTGWGTSTGGWGSDDTAPGWGGSGWGNAWRSARPSAAYPAYDDASNRDRDTVFWILFEGPHPGVYEGRDNLTSVAGYAVRPWGCAWTRAEADHVFTRGVMEGRLENNN